MNKGYFGKYGGTFIPETLSHACEELDHLYAEIKDSDEFKSELTIFMSTMLVGHHHYILLKSY